MLVAASDYVKALPDSIDAGCRVRSMALGTDGFGRSENRAGLREFFEVDYRYVVVATLAALARDGKIDATVVAAGDQDAQHQPGEDQSGDLVAGAFDAICTAGLSSHLRWDLLATTSTPSSARTSPAATCCASWSSRATRVVKDQPVLELETDKATIEVPSSVAGAGQGDQGQGRRQGQGRPGRS